MAGFLEIIGLTKRFGGLLASRDISFSVEQGEIVGLIGANGAGKTTLFNMVAGALRPTGGHVRFEGRECVGLSAYRMAGLGIARTFQHTSLFPGLTVAENLRAGTHLHPAAAAEVAPVLDYLGLVPHREVLAANLSYGDQRKLAIGIALMMQPKLLLLDEPAAGMSPDEARKLVDIILDLRARGLTILIVDHHMKVLMNVCDRVIVLDHGEKIAEGTPAEIASHARVIEVYFGRGSTHEKVEAGHDA